MANGSAQIVQKLWSYCNILRDDGLSYQDYLEQLTTLLFLKMADERASLEGRENPIPEGYRWADLAAPQMEGVKLEAHYRATLETLGKQGGMLGLVFRKAQNKIQDPAKLRRLIADLIDREQWIALDVDVKGAAGPFVLVFNESFHEGWRAYVRDGEGGPDAVSASVLVGALRDRGRREITGHIKVNGYANAWIVPVQAGGGKADFQIILEYRPQKLFELSLVLSSLTAVLSIGYLGYNRTRKG